MVVVEPAKLHLSYREAGDLSRMAQADVLLERAGYRQFTTAAIEARDRQWRRHTVPLTEIISECSPLRVERLDWMQKKARQLLTPQQLRCFGHCYRGCTETEIAKALSLPLYTVRAELRQARKVLTARLPRDKYAGTWLVVLAAFISIPAFNAIVWHINQEDLVVGQFD